MKTRGLIGFLLVVLALALFAVAGDCVAAEGSSSDANPWLGKIRPGFSTGTTSGTVTDGFLDLMIPLWGDQKHLIYLNPQFRMNDAGGNEENLGIGYRGLYFNDQAILGINLFYDTMLSTNDFRYDQFGVGIEALTKWVDLRANYYLPFGTTTNRLPGLDYYRFRETYIGWYRGYEEATEGFDGEVGFLVPIISNVVETRVYAGGYHYNSEVASDVNGWKTRLEVRPVDLFQVNMEVRDDNVRGTDVIVGAYLDIPFSVEAVITGKNPFEGIEKHLVFGKGARPLKERMTDKVERDRDITTFARPTDKDIPDPIANNVIYVNADNPNAGVGTYSNPYKDIASVPSDLRYTDGAWVYVFSWDKLADTYNNVHLRLVNNGVLWGQGYFHPYYRLGGDGLMPILDGGGSGNVLTLAHNNEIMGLVIQNGAVGIYGENILRTNIHDNMIRNNLGPGSGVHIQNVFDPAVVSGSTLAYVIANNTVTGNVGEGIYLSNVVAGSASINNLNISNSIAGNTIANNDGMGIYLSNILSTAGDISGSSVTNAFTGNILNGNGGSGVNAYNSLVAGSGVTGTLMVNTFTGNSVSGNVGYGVILGNTLAAGTSASGSSITNAFTNNSIDSNVGYGVYTTNTLVASSGAIANSSISNAFTSNTVSGNDEHGVALINTLVAGTSVSGSSITNAFTNNSIGSNDGYGIYLMNTLVASSGAIANSSISNAFSDNILDGNVGYGVVAYNTLVASSGAIANSLISNAFTNNTVSGNVGFGIYLVNTLQAGSDVSGSSISNAFTNNTVSGNDSYGIYLINTLGAGTSVSGSSISNTLSDNILNSNDGFGVFLMNTLVAATSVSGSSITNAFTNNSIGGNDGFGIYLNNTLVANSDMSTSGILDRFTNNRITGNTAGMGLYLLDAVVAPGTISTVDVNVFMQGNAVASNSAGGASLTYLGAPVGVAYSADLGGGALGSTGQNSFYGNTGFDLNNLTGTAISAKNNWWGQSTGPAVGQILSPLPPGTVNSTPWLTTAP